MNKSKEKIKENPIVANRAIYMAKGQCKNLRGNICKNPIFA